MPNTQAIIEAVLFASDAPLEGDKIREVAELKSEEDFKQAIEDLNRKYEECQNSFRIREIAGGYQMYTLPKFAEWIEPLLAKVKKQRLSKAALETLSIIAYRQPVSRIDIDQIRGVQSDSALKTVLERELVTIVGRSDTVGRPLMYGTTEQFLIYFGLKDLGKLPRLEEMEYLTDARRAVPVANSVEPDKDRNGSDISQMIPAPDAGEVETRLSI
ncbi:MAG: SMC-Scp complex subunit ScpB [candidate division Zixibacteria bacterium]|nr:SMC-Scp complex subunit ScpB [candidate division Zixibacteria bacterium]